MLKRHVYSPRSARAVVRESAPQARVRVRFESKRLAPALQPLLVTQRAAGYNGFSWELMGYDGQRRISAAFTGGETVPVLFLFFSPPPVAHALTCPIPPACTKAHSPKNPCRCALPCSPSA